MWNENMSVLIMCLIGNRNVFAFGLGLTVSLLIIYLVWFSFRNFYGMEKKGKLRFVNNHVVFKM